MLQQKRLLKKEKLKNRIKITLILSFVLLIIIVIFEVAYLNFGKISIISPLAKNNLSKIASLESQIDNKKISFTSVVASQDGSFDVKLLGGGDVILSSKKDIGSQLTSLQLVLSRLTIEGKKLRNLDFRFDNPVVSF